MPGCEHPLLCRARELSAVFAAREEEADASAAYPKLNIDELFDSGLISASIPATLGGGEVTLSEYVEIVRAIAHGSPSTALLYVMPTALVAATRIPESCVPQEHRRFFAEQSRWIASEVSARKIFAVANSEPGSGGKMSETRTLARLENGRHRLTGKKSFCSYGSHAHYFMCAARDSSGRIDEYLVDASSPEIAVGRDWNALGMRSTESVSIELSDAPALAILGYSGMLDSTSARHWSTLGFAATFLGTGEALFEAARGTSGSSRALAQKWLADFHLFLDAASGYIADTARAESWPPTKEWKRRAGRVKTFITKGVSDHAAAMLNVGGGAAYVGKGPVQRLTRDALAGTFLRPPIALAYEELYDEIFSAPPLTAAG